MDTNKLTTKLQKAGIQFSGCSADGKVWGCEVDKDGCCEEIQEREDVKAAMQAPDPVEPKIETTDDKLTALIAKLEAAGVIAKDQITKEIK